MDEIRRLEKNWDSYDADPIDPTVIAYAVELFAQIATAAIPIPAVVPSSRGGVQFEWHVGDLDFEIWTYQRGVFSGFFAAPGDPPVEFVDKKDPVELEPFVARLAAAKA